MNKKDIKAILHKVSTGNATPEEERIAAYWLHYFRRKDIPHLTEEELTEESDAIYQSLMAEKPVKSLKRIWPRIAVAATTLIILSVGLYFFKVNRQTTHVNTKLQANNKHKILPGSNKAILILANGAKISLTNASIGELAKQAGSVITKTKDGQIVCDTKSVNNQSDLNTVVYNTIQTPKGGQYQIELPDGTKVWLNAASSLQFPTSFKGKERRVQLSGEAYFEVAHNAAKPFKVISKGQQIEVLGTHFNVNAYNDDPTIQTTLLEGSVKLSNSVSQVTLKPNQQAILGNDQNFNVKEVKASDAIAWKNGFFLFKNENIRSVMNKIARWYDVDIEYRGDVGEKELGGSVSRFENISDLLNIIKLTQSIHFKIEGRRVIVMP